jgi:GH25 family lysozyme M1 (1,4-beta-N-acetylmuramidase)
MQELAGPQNVSSLIRPGMSAALAAPAAVPTVPTGPAGAVHGIDIASFQHPPSTQFPDGAPINWTQVAAAGVQFTGIKATEGNYYLNPFYAADLTGSRAAGVEPIGYAFANPKVGNGTAAQQAQYLVTNAAFAGGGEPPLMLDIEYNPYAGGECYGRTASGMVTWLSNFVAQVKTLTGQLPIIYTTQDWWTACTAGSTAFSKDLMWVAAYTTAAAPPLPAGWGAWGMWQYTSSGTVQGIPTTGSTDLDALALIGPGSQQATVGMAASLRVGAATAASGLQYTASGLPAGLTINSAGLISGTPTVSDAAVSATVSAATAGTVLGHVGITWNVHGAITVTAPPARTTTAGSPVDFKVPAAAVPAGQTASFTATGLPSGVTMTKAGQITGWPVKPGSYRVTLHATDGLGDGGIAAFTWKVTAAADHGSAGPVRLDSHGKCLTDIGNKAVGGTRVEAAACNGGAAQHWTVVQDGTLRIHGKCLAVAGSAAVNGKKLEIATCSGGPAQRWTPGTGAELVNATAGKCLAGPAGAANALTWIWSCSGTTNQRWTLPAGPVSSQIPGGCLDDKSDSAANHTPAQVWPCAGLPAQRWTAWPDRTIRIRGKCLEVNHSATAATSPVDLFTCTGAATQKWTVTAQGGGVRLRNTAAGRCLLDPVLPGQGFTSHKAVQLGTCTATNPAIAWRLR